MKKAATKLKAEVDAKVGIKKVYTKRFYVLDVEKLERLAEITGTDVNKLMDLAFDKLIQENEALLKD